MRCRCYNNLAHRLKAPLSQKNSYYRLRHSRKRLLSKIQQKSTRSIVLVVFCSPRRTSSTVRSLHSRVWRCLSRRFLATIQETWIHCYAPEIKSTNRNSGLHPKTKILLIFWKFFTCHFLFLNENRVFSSFHTNSFNNVNTNKSTWKAV